jgi:hypothetical protein
MKKLLLFLLLCLPAFGQTTNYMTGNLGSAGTNCSTTSPFNCVVLQLPPGTQSVGINISGTWVATAQFEGTTNNGNTWISASSFPIPNGLAVTSTTANGTWVSSTAGFTHVRVRNSAFTSGTVVVELSASFATNLGEALDSSGRVITTSTAGVPLSYTAQQGATLLNAAPTVSGANAAAVVTLTGAAGFRVCVRFIAVKATGAAATSTLTVSDGATVVLDLGTISATLAGPSINFFNAVLLCGSPGNNVVVNIGAGGVGAITTTSVIADRQ